jgi:Glycosyl hydrolases family 39
MNNKFVIGSSVILSLLASSVQASLPPGSRLIEAESASVKAAGYKLQDCIFASGGKYLKSVKAGTISKPVKLMQANFFVDKKNMYRYYILWARVRGITLALKGDILPMKTFEAVKNDWRWIKMGRFSGKYMGKKFAIYAAPGKVLKNAGVDCVLIFQSTVYKPSGIYSTVVGPEGKASAPIVSDPAKDAKKNSGAMLNTVVNINTAKTTTRVHKFIASANAHAASRHIIDNPDWDKAMEMLFSDNMLILFDRTKRKFGNDGIWWTFKPMDEFIRRAKTKWKVKEIMFLPKWWVRWENKNEVPPKEALEHGRKVLRQLVERYGKPGPLFIKYWVLSDEWPCRGFWLKDYKFFAKYYAQLVRDVKAVNPKLKVGGPVDCWPKERVIAELLRQSPELDFIGYNLFITGRKDWPRDKVYDRTLFVKTTVESSRKLAKEIRGKELPVYITSLGPNYRAWKPADYSLARPRTAVWTVAALNYAIQGKAASAANYNIRALDCGWFGPNDKFAIRGKMINPKTPVNSINIRPMGRIYYFYKKYMAGNLLNSLVIDGDKKNFTIVSTVDAKGCINLTFVNFSSKTRTVKINLAPYTMPLYSMMDLPAEYVYCDKHTFRQGKGFLFDADGKAIFIMPPYSAYCVRTKK